MTFVLISAFAICALAANSVLIRMAVVDFGADPAQFAVVRVAAGALVLMSLATRGRAMVWPSPLRAAKGAIALAGYIIGFSIAYRSLDTGLGALILFGSVQLTIFAVVVVGGASIHRLQWIGTAIALAGLAYLLRPDGSDVSYIDIALMIGAGVAWGAYTLLGRGVSDPIQNNAANFAIALPLVAPLLLISNGELGAGGLICAVLSGAIASGVGYAAWYTVVARIDAATAGIVQLSVPVIAAFGGLLFVNEPITLRLIVGAALVLGGIAVSVIPQMRKRRP
ncbi:hypothetical protein BVC71_10730 [Marivivens niveibacter]|uniref:EamA domain-containing protein n=1 Tax=Marivivens niveibacter TaxID=1930667 RepID=A0A251WXF0_9RHOB|nr:DMT family transporter [Marivivens niveibacter]OUD09170.1 hypothetical protein BVC71_10730 [Marivivens niveibacter]